MTAPTHAAFGLLLTALAGTGNLNATACALGALLPDIDHPQSSIGRVFFFLSIPINSKFGHRGLTHAYIVYIPFVIAGFFFSEFLMWLAIGAISHIVIDCSNVSGVKAYIPFTQRTAVNFKDEWRIRTGSTPEIFVFIVIAALVASAGYASSIGGARKLINMLARTHKITQQEYSRAGLKWCEIKGRFRWQDGTTEDVQWLVVGTEKTGQSRRLIYWNGNKLIRPERGRFLRSKLLETEQVWNITKVRGIITVTAPSFWMSGGKWHYAAEGQKASGTIKRIDGKPVEIEVSGNGIGWKSGLFGGRNKEHPTRSPGSADN